MIALRPRAPVFRSIASCAIAVTPSSVISRLHYKQKTPTLHAQHRNLLHIKLFGITWQEGW